MSRAGQATSSAGFSKQACQVPHTAASCAAAYGSLSGGGGGAERVVGTGCRAVAQEEPGTLQVGAFAATVANGPSSRSKRSVPQARVYSAVPIGVPKATNPCSGNGLSPRHTSGPSSATRGGAGPPAKLKARVLPRFAGTENAFGRETRNCRGTGAQVGSRYSRQIRIFFSCAFFRLPESLCSYRSRR